MADENGCAAVNHECELKVGVAAVTNGSNESLVVNGVCQVSTDTVVDETTEKLKLTEAPLNAECDLDDRVEKMSLNATKGHCDSDGIKSNKLKSIPVVPHYDLLSKGRQAGCYCCNNETEFKSMSKSVYRELCPDDRMPGASSHSAGNCTDSSACCPADHFPSDGGAGKSDDECCGCASAHRGFGRKRCRNETSDSTGSAQEYVLPGCDVVFKDGIEYRAYDSERHLQDIIRLVSRDLSEPYTIYTFRYFINNWPHLCIRALDVDKCVGVVVCKLHVYQDSLIRGYIAMLAVEEEYRRRGIGTQNQGND